MENMNFSEVYVEKKRKSRQVGTILGFFPMERFYSVSQTNNLSKPLHFGTIIQSTFNLLTRYGTTAVHLVPVLKKNTSKNMKKKRQTISFSFSPS